MVINGYQELLMVISQLSMVINGYCLTSYQWLSTFIKCWLSVSYQWLSKVING